MICPYCNKEAKWCQNQERYGKNYGKTFMCYWCKDCDAYVFAIIIPVGESDMKVDVWDTDSKICGSYYVQKD